jgi:hypothetical protein
VFDLAKSDLAYYYKQKLEGKVGRYSKVRTIEISGGYELRFSS